MCAYTSRKEISPTVLQAGTRNPWAGTQGPWHLQWQALSWVGRGWGLGYPAVSWRVIDRSEFSLIMNQFFKLKNSSSPTLMCLRMNWWDRLKIQILGPHLRDFGLKGWSGAKNAVLKRYLQAVGLLVPQTSLLHKPHYYIKGWGGIYIYVCEGNVFSA